MTDEDDRERNRAELKCAFDAIAALEPLDPSRRFWVSLFACHEVGRQAQRLQLPFPGEFTAEQKRQAQALRIMAMAVESTNLAAEIEAAARRGGIEDFTRWLERIRKELDAQSPE